MKEQEAPSTPETFVPKLTGVGPARLDELKTDFDEARQKFKDGEIDYAQLDEAKDAYNGAKWKADFAQESNQNMRDGLWKQEQGRFLNDNKQYRDNRTLNAAFVTAVNSLLTSDEGQQMSDREILLAAHEQVDADLQGLDSSVASAEDNATHHAGEFVRLDKLEGVAYQEAIDKLMPDQLARYEDL